MNFRDLLSEFFESIFYSNWFSICGINFDFLDILLIFLFISLIFIIIFMIYCSFDF